MTKKVQLSVVCTSHPKAIANNERGAEIVGDLFSACQASVQRKIRKCVYADLGAANILIKLYHPAMPEKKHSARVVKFPKHAGKELG